MASCTPVNTRPFSSDGMNTVGLQDSVSLPDFLLDMDFDEFIPVDNFFPGYLQALETESHSGTGGVQAQKAMSYTQPNQQAPFVTAQTPYQEQPPPLHQHAIQPLSQIFQDQPLQPQEVLQVPLPQAASLQQAQSHQQNTYDHEAIVSPPHPVVGEPLHHGDSSDTSNPEGNSRRPNGVRTGRGRWKTERQQALNKAAQQRYRERKKAKAVELEQAVSSLKEKVDELTIVKREKDSLQEKVDVLEKRMMMQEAKEARGESLGSGDAAADNGKCPSTASMSDLVALYHSTVAKLRGFVTHHNYIDNPNVTYNSLPAQHAQEIRALVHACYNTCMRVHQCMTEVDVYGMLEASIDNVPGGFKGDPQRWMSLVRSLNLSEQAGSTGCALYDQYISKLEAIYHERLELNLKAVKLLLPDDLESVSLSKRMWLEAKSYFKRYRTSHRTTSMLASLKKNLSDEQKALSEIDYIVYIKLLDPLQSTKCILMSYPEHCDVVSLFAAMQAIATEGSDV